MLAVALLVLRGLKGLEHGIAKRRDARVIPFRAVDGPRPEAEHDAHHARLWPDVPVPDVAVEGEPDAADQREEECVPVVARYAHHERRHLLVAFIEAAFFAVDECVLAHRARVYLPERVFELLVAFRRGGPGSRRIRSRICPRKRCRSCPRGGSRSGR